MEETLIKFQENFLRSNENIKYFFIYSDDGDVEAIQPNDRCDSNRYSIEVPDDIAALIHSNQETLRSYKIDIIKKCVVKKKSIDIISIDDVVHRIIEKKYSKDDPDIEIRFDSLKKSLIFSLNSKHFKTIWSGNTSLHFTITRYNDPNDILDFIHFNIEDLVSKDLEIDLSHVTERFSIYTRRIFKNYVMNYL